MLTIRKSTYIFFASLLTLLASCAAHAPSTLTPAQQTQLNLYATVQLIASTNTEVIQAVTSLNTQQVLTDAQTREVLGWAKQVNDASRAALTVLDSAQSPDAKTKAVLALLGKLQLPPTVAAFINAKPTGAAVLAAVNAIVSIQQIIAKIQATPPALMNVAKGTA